MIRVDWFNLSILATNERMESPELRSPQEETAKRFTQLRKLVTAFLAHWDTTLLFVFLVGKCWHERFWKGPVMRPTCPLLLFLLSLPILDFYGFSFVQLYRKHRKSFDAEVKTL